MTLFWCFYCLLRTYFTFFSNVLLLTLNKLGSLLKQWLHGSYQTVYGPIRLMLGLENCTIFMNVICVSSLEVISAWTLFKLLLTLVFICKQRLLHENHIVQYLQNYKYQDVKDTYKLLQTPCKTLLTFKSIKLHFLELVL